MAPRKAGGSGSSSSGGGGGGGGGGGNDDYNNPYYYDPDVIYSPSDLNAFRAELACLCLLVVAAVIALLMVLIKSWLNRDGTRNKSRLIIFLACLVSIIIGHSVVIASLVYTLNGPNGIEDVDYYRMPEVANRNAVSSFFEWASALLFFWLFLFEVSRRNVLVDHKRTNFETFSAGFIFVLFSVACASWIMGLTQIRISDADYFYSETVRIVYETIIYLSIAWACLAFIFATIMALSTPQKATTESISKSHSSRLRMIGRALWFSQALHVSAICVLVFAGEVTLRRTTIVTSLAATEQLMWIVQIIAMALVARDSHKQHRSGTAYTSMPPATQYNPNATAAATYWPTQPSAAPDMAQGPTVSAYQEQYIGPNTAYHGYSHDVQGWPKQTVVTAQSPVQGRWH